MGFNTPNRGVKAHFFYPSHKLWTKKASIAEEYPV